MDRNRTIGLVLVFLLLGSLFVAPVTADDHTTTATPTEEPTETPTSTPTTTDSGMSVEDFIEKAESNADISKEQAKEYLEWFNAHKSEFSVTEQTQVRDWLTEQLTTDDSGTATTTPTTATQTEPTAATASDGDQTSKQDAKQAIKDGSVQRSELGDEYEYPDITLGSLHIKYAEWRGETTTLIVRADTPTTYFLTDPNSQRQTNGGQKVTVTNTRGTLASGWHVLQMNTVENGGDEVIWVSNPGGLVGVSKAGKPLWEDVTNLMLVSGTLGGAIAVFLALVLSYMIVVTKSKKGWTDTIQTVV